MKKSLALLLTTGLMFGCAQSEPAEDVVVETSPEMVEPAPPGAGAETADYSALNGSVAIDGSSTVYPVTEAVAEEFRAAAPNVQVTVGIAGTGGGFKKFCAGETAISDASRPIKAEEQEACAAGSIESIELPIAYDGIAVVINPSNTWATDITVDELKKIWEPNSAVKTWQDVRADWPATEIKLFGPDTDSGTFDYFTDEIVGEEGASRSDYQASADDNVLVTGVAGDEGALGYFGYAYYEENQDKLKLLPIAADGGQPVTPSPETIADGSYKPLSRPIFIYVAKSAAERPEVAGFVDFYLQSVPELAGQVGYVALPAEAYDLVRQRWQNRTTGTIFQDAAGKTVLETLQG